MSMSKEIPKVAFLFLVFAIISGGYVQTVLSCEMQEILMKSVWAKHMIGFILIFILIMMDGQNMISDDDIDDDWSGGNVFNAMKYAFIIYIIFVLLLKVD